MPTMSEPAADARSAKLDTLLAALIVAGTLMLALFWSHHRMMANDEFLSFFADGQPTAAKTIWVQLHYPLSLDPPVYHLLSHFSIRLFGPTEFAVRFPALMGYILMELAVFALVRRIAGSRAAVVAMLFPAITASVRYSVQGRPYGLLLGLYAAGFACWYFASEGRVKKTRLAWIAGLAVCIALAINAHYFGVLILLPLSLAELTRTLNRRKLDSPMVAGLVLGMTSIVCVLPFQRGLAPYRAHYYNGGVTVRAMTQGYRELFIEAYNMQLSEAKLLTVALSLAALGLAVFGYRRFRSRSENESTSFWAGLVALAAMPFFGFLFGRFVTHTMEVRYVIAAVLAFGICLALVLARALRNTVVYAGVLAVLVVLAGWQALFNIRADTIERASFLDHLTPSPAMATAMAARPEAKVYTFAMWEFFIIHYYSPDPDIKNRIRLMYSREKEMEWVGNDTNYVANINLSHITHWKPVDYTVFLADNDPLMLTYDAKANWIDRDLESHNVPRTLLGESYGPGQGWQVHTAGASGVR